MQVAAKPEPVPGFELAEQEAELPVDNAVTVTPLITAQYPVSTPEPVEQG